METIQNPNPRIVTVWHINTTESYLVIKNKTDKL